MRISGIPTSGLHSGQHQHPDADGVTSSHDELSDMVPDQGYGEDTEGEHVQTEDDPTDHLQWMERPLEAIDPYRLFPLHRNV
jgi:hypothetical protein